MWVDCGGLCAPVMEWEAGAAVAGVGGAAGGSAEGTRDPSAAPAGALERVARQRLVSAGTVRADWRQVVAVGRQGGLGREEEEALAWALLPPADVACQMGEAERALGLDLSAGRVWPKAHTHSYGTAHVRKRKR
eukprot:TRINITY_DN14562_c0_g3_i1.p2 TRINITY_DN14562_c0_g3~~TRINITY_DN14562_c0_g3_i1.p2  ORF type:complete len:134 (-),score=9.01 TRINITY_DN14562_c0_g3_i1:326-727(-)